MQRRAWLDVTPIIPITVCHQRNDVERYSRYNIDEVFLTINGQRHSLWRAVDQDDNILGILVQSRRNKQAAKKFFRKLLKGLMDVPRVVITDKLKSYGAAKRERLRRCENSHRPTRQRERRMQGLKSASHAQRFLSAYGLIAQHFRPKTASALSVGVPRRDGEAIRELGRHYRYGAVRLKDG